MTDKLNQKKCQPCEGLSDKLSQQEAQSMLKALNQWELDANLKFIKKSYKFKNFYHTMAFVNAVAFIANQENHHPDIKCGYNYCDLVLTTHAIDGLSENDYILAAKIDKLIN